MKSNKYRVRGCLSTSFPLSYIPGSSNCAEFSFAFSSITPSKFGRYFAQLEGLGINQFQFGKDPVTELLTYKSNTYYISTPSTFMSGSPGWKPLHYHPGSPDRTARHEGPGRSKAVGALPIKNPSGLSLPTLSQKPGKRPPGGMPPVNMERAWRTRRQPT